MMGTNKSWLSAYLYYSGPFEPFLTGAVKPFAEAMIKNKLAEQFFFIRYWELGPHIRLRFKGLPATLENELKPLLTTHFNAWFKDHAPERKDASGELRADHSIHFTGYVPETERYGGPKALLVAEKHFEDSSKAVLKLMQGISPWNYELGLGAAIKMHIAFAFEANMSKREAHAFFDYVFKLWLPFAYNSSANQEPARENALLAFEKNFADQRGNLIAFHNMIWDALETGLSFSEPWLNAWRRSAKATVRNLEKIGQSNKLIFGADEAELPGRRLWPIYGSYVHMTNNRLGILNSDEGYLAYLMSRSLLP